jgi:XTP/dITP diphosphohydrolase
MEVPPSDAPPTVLARLLLATTNVHKLQEFAALLRGVPFTLVDPQQLHLELDVPETGATFAQNAALKARAWAQAGDILALADDSGLEIDALGGQPGLQSARWVGPEVSYPERCRMLLELLLDVPLAQRTARYRCALAVADPRGVRIAVEGTVEGRIALAARGSHGFGYDPIFEVPESGQTFGELDAAEKHRISHRARAVAAALPELRRLAESAQRADATQQ